MEKILGDVFESAKAAIDKRAENLVVLDVGKVSAFADYFVICSVTSGRQASTVCDSIEEKMREFGKKPISVEGKQEGRWVLLDFGDFVVHIFSEHLREFYDLEGLWNGATRVTIPPEVYAPATARIN